MSQFLSHKYLRYRGLLGKKARTIETDTPCPRCDYNLRGLQSDGVCPECGTPIRLHGPLAYSSLSDAPLSEIKKILRGLWLGAACFIAWPAVLIFALIALRRQPGAVWLIISQGLLLITITWVFAVWLMLPSLNTVEGIKRGFRPRERMRDVARFGQLGWLVAMFFAIMPGLAMPVRVPGVLIGTAIGITGIIALSGMLIRLADWCCDEFAERQLNWSVWTMPPAALLLLLMPALGAMRLFFCTSVAMVLWAGGTFIAALLSLAGSVSWSVYHAKDRMDRERRQREKMAKTTANAPVPPEGPIPIEQD